MALFLAPYNDSMRLGQGYNSFLHQQCIDDAFRINRDQVGQKSTSSNGSILQDVNYSSGLVNKISGVVKCLDVSAASCIKNGGIIGSGNSVAVNETTFATSDLNAVFSVKVVNKKTELLDMAEFEAKKDFNLTSESFLKIYGNCFISGFIEGGELTGVVSTKAAAAEAWSGGGQIKPEEKEWNLEDLYAAAAAFPSKVAQCPQRTWAILTPYNHTKNFVTWANDQGIQLPQFETAQAYAEDLLDTYIEYKSCVKQVQAILQRPDAYVGRAFENAIGTGIGELIEVRSSLKAQMNAISQIIDELALRPGDIDKIKNQNPIEDPESWAVWLPVRKALANGI
ncbi:hypothetical protein Neosp_012647 [[Neocosmospora] mangrovei]